MRHPIFIVDKKLPGLNPVQCGNEECEPSHHHGPVVRTHWLLHYVISGYGTFVRDDITHYVQPGHFFVIPPYVETYYEADDKQPWNYIWIGFTSESIPDFLQKPVVFCPDAGRIFHKMLTCRKLKAGRSAFLSSCLWELVSILSEDKEIKPDYIDNALGLIHANFANGITINQIADSLGLNRKYFCSIFTKQVGISPSEYLINYKLNKAVEFMTLYNESITTAAMSAGYEDIYHFSKLFKKRYGVSPREYCKQHKQP